MKLDALYHVGAENDNAYDNVHFCDDRFDDVARDADSPVQVSQENIRDAPVVEAAHVGQCMSGEIEVDPCSVGLLSLIKFILVKLRKYHQALLMFQISLMFHKVKFL